VRRGGGVGLAAGEAADHGGERGVGVVAGGGLQLAQLGGEAAEVAGRAGRTLLAQERLQVELLLLAGVAAAGQVRALASRAPLVLLL